MSGAGRIVHVPEAWLRAERERDNQRQVVRMSAGILFMIAAFVAFVLGIMAWTKGRCDTRAVKWVAGLAFVLSLAGLANAWPQTVMGLTTAEPVTSQYAMLAVGATVGGLVGALVFGIVAGIGAWYARSAPRAPIAGWLPPWLAAVAAAALVTGLQAVIGNLGPRLAPLLPPVTGASSWSPLAGAVLSGLAFVSSAAIALYVLYAVARLTRDWTRHKVLGAVLIVLLQCAVALTQAGTSLAAALAAGAVGGLALAAVLWFLLRYDARIVPAYLATGVVLGIAARAVQDGTPAAYTGAAVAAAVTVAMAWLVTRYIAAALPPAAATQEAIATASSPSTA